MVAMQPAVDHDGALDAAYRRTCYEVYTPTGLLVLQVDTPSAALLDVHRQLGVGVSAFLTAWNPASVAHSAAQNAAAHERLCQRLAVLELAYWPGWGRDPTGEWPPEQSLFVPGLGLEAARGLALEFGQNAIVHMAADAVPRLIWVRT